MIDRPEAGVDDRQEDAGARQEQAAAVVHLFITSTRTGETCVLLVEREPGVVEFPTLSLAAAELDDEDGILQRIDESTGLRVAISGFLEGPADAPLSPPGSRFLLARLIAGSPRIAGAHTGWEWRPGFNLLSLQFAPKVMVDELRSFMNG